jgi:hypothetical protein
MAVPMSRRDFSALTAGLVAGAAAPEAAADDTTKAALPTAIAAPIQAPFERDYPPPAFQPGWKKPQINRLLVQDFIVFAHGDLAMAKRLLEKEPALVNATFDWGKGDWESGLGGASNMGRREPGAG